MVAPLFLSDGYPLRIAFPRSLGLTGLELAQCVHLLPPLFAWPEVIEMLSAEIRRTAMSGSRYFSDCTVVLAAHGSSKGPGSARATAAVAGILFASKGSIDPNAGLLGIKAFAAAVIGGFGSLPGALAGGLIVGLVEPFAARYVEAGYSQVAPYALMLIVLILRPHGIVSQVRSKKV